MSFIRPLSMPALAFLAASSMASAVEQASPFDNLMLDAAVHATGVEPFIAHEGAGPFGSYLAMAIPFAPIESLYTQVQRTADQTLISRGEAHVTVVTPVEYDQQLKSHLSIVEINALALAQEIQATPISIICLGQGTLTTEDGDLHTYFVVIDSAGLLELRRAIHRAFVQAGGDPEAFVPDRFYPHVTVGFTKRDLHLEDGILKDRSSCIGALRPRDRAI